MNAIASGKQSYRKQATTRTFDQVLQSLTVQTDDGASSSKTTNLSSESNKPLNSHRVKSSLRQLGFVWNAEHKQSSKDVDGNVEFDALVSNIRSFKCRSKQLAKARKLNLSGQVQQAEAENSQLNEQCRKKATEKYRAQKYRLFSRYDRGVQLDDESWWSVTPEQIALHHAQRCACDVIADACCGVGGNAIQFARTCSQVLAFDIDASRLRMARHNAAVYDDDLPLRYSDKLQLQCCDFVQFVTSVRPGFVDVVFLDLPWGGPQYLKKPVYDLDTMQIETVLDGRRVQMPVSQLFQLVAERVTRNIALFAPRNCDSQQLVALARFTDGRVELEQNLLNRKLKTVTAYYGALVKT